MATTKKSAIKTSAKKSQKSQASSPAAEVTKQQRALFSFINSNIDNVQDIAKKTYLVGLGAVGRSYEEVKTTYKKANDEVQSRYKKINSDSQEFVKDLVDRGEKVQDGAEELLKDSKASIEEQIEVAKKRLSGIASVVDVSARLKDVSNKLETLSKDLKKTA